MNGTLEGLYSRPRGDEWRTDPVRDSYDDNEDGSLPVLYDADHAAFMDTANSDGFLQVAEGEQVAGYSIRDDYTNRPEGTGPEEQAYVLKEISEFQERRDDRPQIDTTAAYVADYTVVNDDRHDEILGILDDAVNEEGWKDTGTAAEGPYPDIDWAYVQDAADSSLSDRRISTLQSRYEEPVDQHLSLSLVPDGGLWSASGDFLSLRFEESKPCAYSIEGDYPASDVLDSKRMDELPDTYDVENAVQLRIVRIPTDKERSTSLTPQLFDDLDAGMEVTVRGAYSDDLSMADVDPDRPLVLMGTGSGGVPVNSIADAVLESKFEEPAYLFQTAKYRDHFLHNDRMKRAGRLRDTFHPVHSATREWAIDPDYDGPSGYPQHELLRQVDPAADADTGELTELEQSYLEQDPDPDAPAIDPDDPVYLACGNSYFGEDLDRVLDALYVDDRNRHMEIFGG